MIETYDALCLREPWLELILLNIKTLESRTKCLRKTGGVVVLVSSLQVDDYAMEDPSVGGRLDAFARERAFGGLGKLAGIIDMGGFRPGVPGVDDAAALINILLTTNKTRFVASCANPRRVVTKPTKRLRPNGEVCAGASQGFFKIPKSYVEVI